MGIFNFQFQYIIFPKNLTLYAYTTYYLYLQGIEVGNS